jgi:Flp pilus assembly protein CpaB
MTPASRASRTVRRVRRSVLAHRRGLAALCAGLAVLVALQAQAAPPPPRSSVLVASRDLAAGVPVSADDLTRGAFAPDSVPEGVIGRLADAVGRTTVGPVRRGEPLTDVRLLGAGMLERHPGSVVVPVRIGDQAAVDLLRVGDRVDILAADPQGDGPATTVASRVPVVAIPPAGRNSSGLVPGALVVVATTAETARRIAGLGVAAYLSVVLVR